MPGQKLSADDLVTWFGVFYRGLDREFITWFPYADMDSFEDPSIFRTDNPIADAESALILEACIRPCILPVRIGATTHSSPPSFEFYHPVVCARQLSFGQLPIRLPLAERVRPRCSITSAIEAAWLPNLGSNIPIGDLSDIILAPSASKMFKIWWQEWRTHLFCASTSTFMAHLDTTIDIEEVREIYIFLLFPLFYSIILALIT